MTPCKATGAGQVARSLWAMPLLLPGLCLLQWAPGGPVAPLGGHLGVRSTRASVRSAAQIPTGHGELLVGNRDSLTRFSLPSDGGDVPPGQVVRTSQGQPAAAVLDAHGNLWVGSCSDHTVAEYPRKELLTSGARTPTVVVEDPTYPTYKNIISCPDAMAFDTRGDLWVATGTETLVEYSPAELAHDGSPLPERTIKVVHAGPGGFWEMHFASDGDLWVLTASSQLIEYTSRQLAVSGAYAPQAVIACPQFEGGLTTSFAFDASGDLWSANLRGTYELVPRQLRSSGEPSAALLRGSSWGDGVSFDARGDMWVFQSSEYGSFGPAHLFEYRPSALRSSSPEPALEITSPVPLGSTSGTAMVGFSTSGTLWLFEDQSVVFAGYSSAQLTSAGLKRPAVIMSSVLSSPAGMAFDARGDLWAVGTDDGQLDEFTPSELAEAKGPAKVIYLRTRASSGPNSATAAGLGAGPLAFDAKGDLWIGCSSDVLEYSPAQLAGEGSVKPQLDWHDPTGHTIDDVTALVFDAQGDLWLASGGKLGEVPVYQLSQGHLPHPQYPLSVDGDPIGLAFDAHDNLWVTFATLGSRSELAEISLQNRELFRATTGGTLGPGLAFDGAGNLWATDENGPRLVEYSSEELSSHGDGPLGALPASKVIAGPRTRLYGPEYLAVHPSLGD